MAWTQITRRADTGDGSPSTGKMLHAVILDDSTDPVTFYDLNPDGSLGATTQHPGVDKPHLPPHERMQYHVGMNPGTWAVERAARDDRPVDEILADFAAH